MDAAGLYQETAVTTQSKGRLIVMLYDRAVQCLWKALNCIEKHEFKEKSLYLGKARDIICELNQSINIQAGGELSQNLRMLYNFLWRYLSRANISNDTEMIHKSIGILEDLAGAWRKIVQE
mgnify:CR=1 FL=1